MAEAIPTLKRSDIGFLTLAYGSKDYVEMAVDMALSLREWHDEPIAIAVDAPMEAYIAERYPAAFDHVVRMPASLPIGRAYKFGLAEVTPFARTVFIDADTIVMGGLDAVLADAERADLTLMGSPVRPPTTSVHNGAFVDTLIREFGLEHYFTNHTGAFTFEREFGCRFFAECLDVWMSGLRGYGDEVVVGVVAARRGTATMREPYPVYWEAELHGLRRDNRWKPLCHFHLPLRHNVMKWLMAEVVERRRRAGLSSSSIGHWLRKRKNKSMPFGWFVVITNWDLRFRTAWHLHRYDRRIAAATPNASKARMQVLQKKVPPKDWNFSNLLFHATQRRQELSTPHVRLAVGERRDGGVDVPVALAIHCWPDAPDELRVLFSWREQDHEPVLGIDLLGPLPKHPDSIVCIRFRGRQAKELDPTLAMFANLRANLVSPGTLQGSVLAVGVGDDYLASAAIDEAARTADQRLRVPPGEWLADRDELFLDFRLSVASLVPSSAGVRVELSRFHLGQKIDHSPADHHIHGGCGAGVVEGMQ